MQRDLKNVEGTFRSNGFTFVCEGRYHDVDLPGAVHHECRNAKEKLLTAGVLPDLAGAPVASWLLARIARLAGKRFPYSYGEVAGSDIGSYWVRYFVLSQSDMPIGILSVSGNVQEITLSLAHTTGAVPEESLRCIRGRAFAKAWRCRPLSGRLCIYGAN